MATYREKEQRCLQTFLSEQVYWHVYTPGKETGLIFHNESDYSFAMNILAQSSLKYPKVKIVTFAIMDNHIHLIMIGDRQDILEFFKRFRKKLARGLKDYSEIELPNSFVPIMKEISDLNAMRNEIIYVNRNGYVANECYTPFNYPWSACGYYFNQLQNYKTFSEISDLNKRKMFRGRIPVPPIEWMITQGYVAPSSYCEIQFGMAMFRDAHHYFSALFKNVETYSGIAVEINDGEYLSDEEAFGKLQKIMKDKYNQNGYQ